MNCTPEFEDRARKIVGRVLLTILGIAVLVFLSICAYFEPINFAIVMVAFVAFFGSIFALMWCSGDVSFCKRPSKYEEDDSEYEDML
jgi:hypothetical protein|tara:strand:- start:561 stop:821 length:261 start_codon:yes stop_codon:yes gene_type:complete